MLAVLPQPHDYQSIESTFRDASGHRDFILLPDTVDNLISVTKPNGDLLLFVDSWGQPLTLRGIPVTRHSTGRYIWHLKACRCEVRRVGLRELRAQLLRFGEYSSLWSVCSNEFLEAESVLDTDRWRLIESIRDATSGQEILDSFIDLQTEETK